MHFNTINALCFFSALLAGGMASPIGETSLERRGLPPHPNFGGCPPANPVTQINQCNSGTPFCCSPTDSGGHNCVKSDVSCDQTVICCNNNGGVQLCMGGTNINIDMPININI
ncbi:hypothetical protein V8E54_007154 [Elaphomyces granulatus]|jgi:hypothetical protein